MPRGCRQGSKSFGGKQPAEHLFKNASVEDENECPEDDIDKKNPYEIATEQRPVSFLQCFPANVLRVQSFEKINDKEQHRKRRDGEKKNQRVLFDAD